MANQIAFGDSVVVLDSPETASLGLAGLKGPVYGETTPSVTGVDVIGTLLSDYALNVYFEEMHKSFWFAPQLLELIDHAPGTTIALDGLKKKWERTPSGEWSEQPAPQRPWWKFW